MQLEYVRLLNNAFMLTASESSPMVGREIMRILSWFLFAAAVVVAAGAVLLFIMASSLACGYAPRSTGCTSLPWELQGDDRFWLVSLPLGIVLALLGLGTLARRKAQARRVTPTRSRPRS